MSVAEVSGPPYTLFPSHDKTARGFPRDRLSLCVCVGGLLVYVHGDPSGNLAQDPPGDPPGGGGDGPSSARALNATKRVALIRYACGLALVIGWHAPVLGREGRSKTWGHPPIVLLYCLFFCKLRPIAGRRALLPMFTIGGFNARC